MKQARILIVEDELSLAEVLALRLDKLGYEVVGTVTNGADAVESASVLRPDLVLMDIVLPGHLDGIQAAQIIRDRFLIPVIYLTAFTDEETLDRAKITDPFGYIVKPYTPRELQAVMHIALHRAKVDRRLREAAQTNAILMSICDGIVSLDTAGRLTHANAAAEKILLHEESVLLGQPISELISLEDEGVAVDLMASVRRLCHEGGEMRCENHAELLTASGRRMPVQFNMSCVREPGGHVHGVVLLLHDDSERRQSEQALVESEQKFRTLAENTDVAIFVYRQQFIYFNAKALELSGYDEATLRTKGLLDLIHPDHREAIASRLASRLAGDYQPRRYEIKIVTPTGEVRWMDIASGLIPFEGQPAGIATAFDITERKQQENQLTRLNRTLQTLTACNEALVRSDSEQVLIEKACQIIAATGDYPLAWVGYAQADAARSVKAVAQAGPAVDYLQDLSLSWADEAQGRGPTGTAIREGKTCIMRNAQEQPEFAPWREQARRFGFLASIALPLIIDDEVVGALNVYSPDKEAFDKQEVELLENLAVDLAYGIQSMRARHAMQQAELARREAEESYRRTVEVSFDMIAVYQDGHIAEVNQAGLGVLGVTDANQVLGRPLRDILANAESAQVEAHIDRILTEGEPMPLHELELRRLDGAVIHAEVTGIPMRYRGRPAVQIVVRDISARKQAEDQRLRHQQGMTRLDNWVRELLHITRERGAFYTLVCDAVLDLVQADLSALPMINEGGHDFTYVAAAGNKADLLRRQSLPLDQGGLCGWVARHNEALRVEDLRQDERVIPELAQALEVNTALVVPLLHEGEIIGGLSAFRRQPAFDEQDLELLTLFAQRVSIALSTLGLFETLEQRVQERTVDLEAINHELEAFAYSVSHDLRAPLRSIDGFSKALLDDCGEGLNADCRDHIRRVRAASQRMGELIDDMLLLSRVTRADMRRERLDLSELAAAIVGELRAEDPLRDVSFDIMPNLVVKGDARLLRVLLENLLGNAWKFTRDRAQAKISFARVEIDHEPVFRVRDNGAGFDMAYVDKLFAPFQRLHGVREFEGTGVGLATVQRVVQRHGGKVWAEGVPGAGATFFFTLP